MVGTGTWKHVRPVSGSNSKTHRRLSTLKELSGVGSTQLVLGMHAFDQHERQDTVIVVLKVFRP